MILRSTSQWYVERFGNEGFSEMTEKCRSAHNGFIFSSIFSIFGFSHTGNFNYLTSWRQ